MVSPGGGRFQGGIGRPQCHRPFGRLEEASRLEEMCQANQPELPEMSSVEMSSVSRGSSTATASTTASTSASTSTSDGRSASSADEFQTCRWTDTCESGRSTIVSMVGESLDRGAATDLYEAGLASRWSTVASTALRGSVHSELRARNARSSAGAEASIVGSVGSGRRDTKFGNIAATLERTKDGKKPRATKLGNQFATASVLTDDRAVQAARAGREIQQKGKKPVQPELSEATAISGRKHRRFAREGEGTCWQMSSFGETKGMKLIERVPAEWATHNTQQFSRTYPKVSSKQ